MLNTILFVFIILKILWLLSCEVWLPIYGSLINIIIILIRKYPVILTWIVVLVITLERKSSPAKNKAELLMGAELMQLSALVTSVLKSSPEQSGHDSDVMMASSVLKRRKWQFRANCLGDSSTRDHLIVTKSTCVVSNWKSTMPLRKQIWESITVMIGVILQHSIYFWSFSPITV